jgi:hypothetical protein
MTIIANNCNESGKTGAEADNAGQAAGAQPWDGAEWDITLWTKTLNSSGIPIEGIGSCDGDDA